MHELSIAQSIVESVGGHVAAHGGGRVVAVAVRVGALSGVEAPALAFAWGAATAGTPLAGSRLEVEEVPAEAWCPSCQAERALVSIQRLRCPRCGTPTPRIVRGRELEILEVELAPAGEAMVGGEEELKRPGLPGRGGGREWTA
jgi:hydrogenase nickel incorporation protein HypA/HybF